MNTSMVSSEEDLLRALLGLTSNHFLDLKFVNYPRMVIDADDGIDVMRNGRRLARIQEAVQRQYGLVKHGTRDLRRLRAAEKEAVRVTSEYLRGGSSWSSTSRTRQTPCSRRSRRTCRRRRPGSRGSICSLPWALGAGLRRPAWRRWCWGLSGWNGLPRQGCSPSP